ncbi:MAG: SIR2 family protein [Opitutales bacterium]|nr:SIR2 family protein [Opitutales bacterium]
MTAGFTDSATVFLLGAGFSKWIDLGFPLMAELPERLKFRPNSAAEKYCDLTFRDDFEVWLSSLASVCPWVDEREQLSRKEAYFEVLRAIQVGLITPTMEVIESFSYCALDSVPWHYLFKLIDYCHEHRITIFSLNYDTSVEGVAANYLFRMNGKRATEFDFYPQSDSDIESFKIWKLHGSINLWSKDSLGGTNLEKIETCDEERWRQLLNKGYAPYIVPPLSVKDTYYGNAYIQIQWEQALTKLKEADRLVVMGYSFPASDWIMKAFLRNLSKTATVDVVDISSKALSNAQSIFSPEGRQVNAFMHPENPIDRYLKDWL